MLPGFGAHYRMYRLAATLDRLRELPPGTMLSLSKAAQLLGMNERQVRELLRRFASDQQVERCGVSAGTLSSAARQAYQARKRS